MSKTTNGSTITHIWDGSNIAAELDNAGSIYAIYIRGINLIYTEDGTGTKRYCLFNAHGDVIELTGNTGTLIKAYDYDAFGNEVNPDLADINPFRYCGEYFDKETGTIYLRTRYYDPGIGRFISEDSVRGKKSDPLSLNLYTYCHNRPIFYSDPSGHMVWWATGLIGGAADVIVRGIVDLISDGHLDMTLREGISYFAEGFITGSTFGLVDPATLGIVETVAAGSLSALAGNSASQSIRGVVNYNELVQAGVYGGCAAGISKAFSIYFSSKYSIDSINFQDKNAGKTLSGYGAKSESYLTKRGWTWDSAQDVVGNPYTTREAVNKATGNSATVFYNKAGDYVVRDSVTGELVQTSKFGDVNWSPDSSIINPYKP